MFRSRGGALLAGILAALLAAILLIVYLHSYRSSVNSGKQPVTVLVAKSLIPRGTSGDIMARQGLYQVTTVRKDQLVALAIANPARLRGQIAARDINPGEQLTVSDLTAQGEGGIPYEITGPQRALAVPVDATHGLIGQVQSGNFVDVYVALTAGSSPTLRLLAPNVLVLVAPGGAGASSSGIGGSGNGNGGSSNGNAILRLTTAQVPKFALAADNARIWLVLRPQVGASKTPPTTITLSSLLASRG
jgi:Flp pilus assembly protein CpaB